MEKDKAGLLIYIGIISFIIFINPYIFINALCFLAMSSTHYLVAFGILLLIFLQHIILPAIATAIAISKSRNKYLNGFLNNFILQTIIFIILLIFYMTTFDYNAYPYSQSVAILLTSLFYCYFGIYFVIVINKMICLIKRLIRRRG